MSDTGQIALLVRNPMLQRRVTMAATALQMTVVEVTSLNELNLETSPTAIVLELELPGVIDAITNWKSRWPRCFIAAAIAIPDQELWIAATAAGCDLVANRGALPNQLQKKLKEWNAGISLIPERERLLAKRIINPGDGLVGRVADAPDGVITIFRIDDKLCAIRDVCPHAGYSLADGVLEGTVITCPQHGSRFDVCTGERIRGPADYPVQTYQAFESAENLYIEV